MMVGIIVVFMCLIIVGNLKVFVFFSFGLFSYEFIIIWEEYKFLFCLIFVYFDYLLYVVEFKF